MRPPEFLPAPRNPAITWMQWRKLFENYPLASGNKAHPTGHRQVLLLRCSAVEGQRIFYALPEQQSSASTGKEQDTGTAQKTTCEQDEFTIALAKLKDYFVATTNIVVERQRFRQRAQLPGESVVSFVTGLRELSVTCDFGTQLEEFIRDQLVEKTGHRQLRERLLLEGSALTLQRALHIARIMEATEQHSLQLTPCTDVHVVHRLASSSFMRRECSAVSRAVLDQPPQEFVGAAAPRGTCRIAVQACFGAPVVFRDRQADVLFYVVPEGTAIMGLDAIIALRLQIDGSASAITG
ncbi:uncharacterized protein LOC125943402 [Dermacentor silvarum]|uniref:uncharacterized protein LOC125943402 n=1 Tax=Dermacentor silvarum TaxID=543639 RepID=UPI0021015FCA|nr:uncharacterized protein LOC125943402 [Dermacentor silvarum]